MKNFSRRTLALAATLCSAVTSAAVNPDGSFSHRVVIAMPPAPGNVQPSLAVSYNSNASDSYLGRGFQLEGLPVISRVAVHFQAGKSKELAGGIIPAPIAREVRDGHVVRIDAFMGC